MGSISNQISTANGSAGTGSVNKYNNIGFNALLGAALGGGVGATVSYLSKPYLKKGEPRKFFEKEISKNLEVLKKTKIEQLKNCKTNDEIVKIVGDKALRKYLIQVTDTIRKGNLLDAFIYGQQLIELEFKNYIKPKELYADITKNVDNVSKEYLSCVEKATKTMNKKCSLILGGITALLTGLGTYFLTKNNNNKVA